MLIGEVELLKLILDRWDRASMIMMRGPKKCLWHLRVKVVGIKLYFGWELWNLGDVKCEFFLVDCFIYDCVGCLCRQNAGIIQVLKLNHYFRAFMSKYHISATFSNHQGRIKSSKTSEYTKRVKQLDIVTHYAHVHWYPYKCVRLSNFCLILYLLFEG